MHKIEISTSGGYSLEAETHQPQEYYRQLAFYTEGGDPIQKRVWSLSVSKDIEAFKKEFHIHKIIHLSLGPCGVHQFTIEDDIFTFRLGQSEEEFYKIDEVLDVS